jgi:predicted nucleic-acid-binding protein
MAPMIGIDTNILVRYLTPDDPIQSAKAAEVLERRLTEKNPGFVSVVAMVKTVWVLDRAYFLRSQEIATAIERLLQVEVLAIETSRKCSLRWSHSNRGADPYADALIAELGARVGCTRTLTFDRKVTRLSGFELV